MVDRAEVLAWMIIRVIKVRQLFVDRGEGSSCCCYECYIGKFKRDPDRSTSERIRRLIEVDWKGMPHPEGLELFLGLYDRGVEPHLERMFDDWLDAFWPEAIPLYRHRCPMPGLFDDNYPSNGVRGVADAVAPEVLASVLRLWDCRAEIWDGVYGL